MKDELKNWQRNRQGEVGRHISGVMPEEDVWMMKRFAGGGPGDTIDTDEQWLRDRGMY